MTTAYPTALDDFTNPAGTDSLATGHAQQHQNINDAVEAIEAELGVLPKGAYATVRARLEGIESTLSSHNHTGIYQPLDTELTALAGLTSAANKVPRFTGSGTADLLDFLDDDSMTANSATAVASQQSIKAYVDAAVGSGLSDGDKGDITVSVGGTVWTIDNSVVTYAKIQNVSATARILGRNSVGAGVIEELDESTFKALMNLEIGTDVQAYDAELAAVAGLTSAADRLPYFTGSGTADVAVFTAAGRAILDDADASAQRTTLGLGSIAIQNSNNVAITGGTIDGIEFDGGTYA